MEAAEAVALIELGATLSAALITQWLQAHVVRRSADDAHLRDKRASLYTDGLVAGQQ